MKIMVSYTQGQGLISQRRGSIFYFYHYDGLGSTKALTDASQNIQASYIYDAWGNILQTNGTVINPYLYVGELGYYTDGDTGMYLLTQRWYNLLVGRFVVRDPADELINLYIYGRQNPLSFVDPSGLGWLDPVKDWVKGICCKIKEFFQGEIGTYLNAILEIFAKAMGGNSGAAIDLLAQLTSCANVPDALKICEDMARDVARKGTHGDMADQVISCTACCIELGAALGLASHPYTLINVCNRACWKAADKAKETAEKPRPKPKPPTPNPPAPKPPKGKK